MVAQTTAASADQATTLRFGRNQGTNAPRELALRRVIHGIGSQGLLRCPGDASLRTRTATTGIWSLERECVRDQQESWPAESLSRDHPFPQ
mmetsp:Transcript_18891/g.54981  ORF Transcript_18891/g.54981 Transcript_18891/m.54981 type:complete len:91 (-) Transcript_18891:12-284(-)